MRAANNGTHTTIQLHTRWVKHIGHRLTTIVRY